MFTTKEEYIQKLKGCTNYSKHYETVQSWGTQPKLLYALYLDLDHAVEKYDLEEWVPKSSKEGIMRSLTLTAGNENVTYTFALANKYLHTLELRIVATMLAMHQKKSDVLAAIEDNLQNEELHGFFHMLLHELVIRKNQFDTDEELEKIAERLNKSKLAKLPLYLTAIETKFRPTTFHNYAAFRTTPTPQSTGGEPIAHEEKQAIQTDDIKLLSEPALEQQCFIAFDDWMRNSNGKVVVQFGQLVNTELQAEEIIGSLFNKQFEPQSKLLVAIADPERIIAMLFAASANSGAYSKGELCAYGRLKAWHTFLALCGQDFDKDRIDSIQTELDNYLWYEFISNEWFYRSLSWDVGIICIDKQNNNVRALIATDTD